MKIAFVRTASNILKYGGYNIQEIGLAKALLKYGISTDVYARFSNIQEVTVIDSDEYGNTVTIHPLKGKQIWHELMYYPNLKRDLLSGGYAMVQLLDDSQMMLPMLFKALKKSGIKTILWQGMYKNFSGKLARLMQIVYDALFARSLNKYSDLKIAKTQAAKDYLVNKHYTNIEVLPVGLDQVQAELDVNLDKQIQNFKNKYSKLLLYIGAVEPRRNPLFIIELLKQIKNNDIGLVIVGKGVSLSETINKIKEYKLENRVLTYESVSNKNLISIFNRANIFLLPTNYEIYGMVVMEALLYGVPVISTPEAGPQYLLSDSVYGKCVELDIDKWSNEIDYYLVNHTSNNDKLQRKNYVNDNFRWGPIAERYYKLLYNLVYNT